MSAHSEPHDRSSPADPGEATEEAAQAAGNGATNGEAAGQAGPEADAAPGIAEPADPAAAIAELEDRWRRAMAELDNQRKRHARALQQERETEHQRVAAAWLPVLDHLDLALSHAGTDPGALAEGVQAIRDQAVQVMRSLGYPRHDETGVSFDPALHEVVSVVDAPDAAPGTVVDVVRAGYGDPGRQLRPAVVTVSRKQE